MSRFSIQPRAFDHPDVELLVEAVQLVYVERYGNRDDDRTAPAEFAPPHGRFFVGYVDARAVASGGWRRTGPHSAEIKRMFVLDQFRGQGLARQMLAALEDSARADGITAMVLNTGYAQPEAMALYESSGYTRTQDRFGHYAAVDGAHFYAKSLADRPAPDRLP